MPNINCLLLFQDRLSKFAILTGLGNFPNFIHSFVFGLLRMLNSKNMVYICIIRQSLNYFYKCYFKRLTRTILLQAIGEGEGIVHFIVLKDI